MLKNQRNTLHAKSGQPQPLQWADCHIPHIDTVYLGTRSQAQRQALPANSGNGQPPPASLLRLPTPLVPWSLGPSVPRSLVPRLSVPCLCTPLPSKGNHPRPTNPSNSANTANSANPANSANFANPAGSAPQKVCRYSTHLHDSASHPRLYFPCEMTHPAPTLRRPPSPPKVTTYAP
jgi:hypothetical protein